MNAGNTEKIDVKKYNKEMVEMLQNTIKEIEIGSQTVSDSECEAIGTLWIDKRFAEEYRRLKTLLEMFNYNAKERNEAKDTVYLLTAMDNKANRNGYKIKGVALPRSVYPKFFELLNKTTTLIYPKDFEMAGMIPGLNIPVPRLRRYKEPIDHYEECLHDHYKNYRYFVDTDEYGIRYPYPHERLEWIKGQGVENPDYVNPYYQEYYNYMLDKLGLEEVPTMGEKIKNGIANLRNKAEKRKHRIKEKKSAKEFFKGIKAKMWDGEEHKKTRRFLIVAGAIIGGVTLGNAFGIVSINLINLLNTIVLLPGMIGPAITGYGHAVDGHELSAAEVTTVRQGLFSLITGAGLGVVGFLKSRLKKKKKKKENLDNEEDIPKTKTETNFGGDSDDSLDMNAEIEKQLREALIKNRQEFDAVKANTTMSPVDRIKKMQELLVEHQRILKAIKEYQGNEYDDGVKRGMGR